MRADPTPHADVNALLDLLLSRIRAALGARLVGLYLYGSLAAGDFERASSDVDFLAAIDGTLTDDDLARLALMHADIAATGGPWGTRLEGAYMPLAALRRDDPANTRHPFLSEDTPFGVHALGRDWVINRHVLRERGIVLYGPPPATLIDPISREQLLAAVRQLLRTEWSQHTDGPVWMRSRRYQAFVILTMCRALYVLARGDFVSKPVAAQWAEEALAPEWTPLIRRALAWRHDDTADADALPETLRLLRFTIDQC